VTVWLVNVADTYSSAYKFVGEAQTTLPVLLDREESLYGGYALYEAGEGYGPFPLQVIIDGDGVIRYLNRQYDAGLARAQIEALLAE